MPRNTNHKQTQPSEAPKLLVDRGMAFSRIEKQIEQGQKLMNLAINTMTELENVKREKSKWHQFNIELLRQMFSNERIMKEYMGFARSMFGLGDRLTMWQEADRLREDIADDISRLESIRDRLELFSGHESNGESVTSNVVSIDKSVGTSSNVFIVHGHDNEAKQTVARFIEQIGLKPIILHEQGNRGQTVIEKLETNSQDVSFAIVLLTPDDIGRVKSGTYDEDKPRARQNVILELGYFLGKIGRNRVCALYKPGVEIPSDYAGVLFVEMDSRDGWKRDLARELRESGIEFDAAKALF